MENIRFLQRRILSWYKGNGRHHLPWRKPHLTDYEIIIAEVLLQRTKAETVEKIYREFILFYPDWNSIITRGVDSLEEKLKPIGLYKQRSSRILALAHEMINRKGLLPKEENGYKNIPMMGQYITNAVLLQVFKVKKPLLDVNMARVLERFFGKRKLADIRYDPYLQELAHEVVRHKNSKEISWAILDFAGKICKSGSPKCTVCSLSIRCTYFKSLKTSLS